MKSNCSSPNTCLSVEIQEMIFPGSEDVLIRDLHLETKQGEIVTILGPSGVGKTTLLRIIAGLETRAKAQIFLEGENKRAPSRDIQLLFQDVRLLPWMKVRDNILFALDDVKKLDRRRADKLLEDVGLPNIPFRWPKDLSGGERARVALARALFGDARVLLFDEPFANLDPKTKYNLQDIIVEKTHQRTTHSIIVTHSIEDAVLISDRVIYFAQSPISEFEEFSIDLPKPRRIADPKVRDHIVKLQEITLSL